MGDYKTVLDPDILLEFDHLGLTRFGKLKHNKYSDYYRESMTKFVQCLKSLKKLLTNI